jgi:membrane associated rhomboid family serine protease
MGLLGLLLVLGRRQGKDVPAGLVRVLRQGVIISVILTAAIGFIVPNVNNYAHLGGFCAGALIGLVMPPVHAIGGRDLARWEKVAFTAVIAVGAVAMIFAAVNLVQVLTTFPASPAPGL